MKIMEVKDLLINKDEIEFTNRDNNSIIVKIRKAPYILYIDYNNIEEMNKDYELLNSNCPMVSAIEYNSYRRITAN